MIISIRLENEYRAGIYWERPVAVISKRSTVLKVSFVAGAKVCPERKSEAALLLTKKGHNDPVQIAYLPIAAKTLSPFVPYEFIVENGIALEPDDVLTLTRDSVRAGRFLMPESFVQITVAEFL